MIHLVAERLWDWSADLDRIADLDGHFELRTGRGDQVRTSTRDPRLPMPEANATRHRPASPRQAALRPQPHPLDRPPIKIASRDFH